MVESLRRRKGADPVALGEVAWAEFPHHSRSPFILRNRTSREGVMGVVPAEMSSGNGDAAAFGLC